MKKVMKFVKGKKDDDNIPKNSTIDAKKLSIDKSEDSFKEDDFINRDKSVTKLHKAVWNENSDKLKTIIKTHDIDITDRFDRTALYLGVIKNNSSIINLLLENNANQNIPDIDGITPFLKSIQLGYKDCAATLLNQGADLKKTDKDLNSCLHYAVLNKHNEILSFLLEYDIDCNVANINGDLPIHIAIRMRNIQMIDQLLKNKSDTSMLNLSGFSALMLAEQQNNPEIMALIEKYSTKALNVPSISDDVSLKSSYENLKPEKFYVTPIATSTTTSIKAETVRSTSNFYKESEIAEENSEDVSIKCSENTSPQSGIIPPPCKPLRSLEYLQTGMTMENRPIHLLTLGTVRTRHISMTESDQSKNTTPHRYSYQGDFQSPVTSETCKIPEDKSKLLSKLECDSTIQSDWGSNESLPLDEFSFRKDKSNSNNSNSGSIRDKTADTFLQKQFSILEDYERKLDALKAGNNPENKLDDIENLLEDNNRINAQLEKFAGQSDVLVRTTKSKSLPRNCEQYSSFHKGSYSLPRTLESGKDPFREMRNYGYFKPRSHFFSLKMLKGEKKNTFLDKLKNMFNKKSQIHLQDHESNGTWLYKEKYKLRHDHEFYSSKLDTFSMSDSSSSRKSHHSDLLNEMRCGLEELQEDEFNQVSITNNEQNKANEKRRSLNMNRESFLRKPSTSHQTYKDVEEEQQINKKKYEEELQKLRLEKAQKQEKDELALKFKEDADRWKKQYEDLVQKIQKNSQEEDWRNLIQNEVTTAVNMLKENSQSLINSLEKQNKKLEAEVEKLQQDLESTKQNEQDLKKDLNIMKNHLDEIYYQSEKDMKSSDDKLHHLRQNNDKLSVELEHLKMKYKELQKSSEINLKFIKDSDEEKQFLSEKHNDLQVNHNLLQSEIIDLIAEMNELKKIAVTKFKTIRYEIEDDDFEIIKSLDTELSEITEENSIQLCHDLLIGFKKIINLNSQIISSFKETKIENIDQQESLNKNIEKLREKDEQINIKEETIKEAMNEIFSLKEKLNESNDIIDELTNDLKNKEDVTSIQSSKICDLKEILEDEIQKCNEISIINKSLKSDLDKHDSHIVSLQQIREDLEQDILNMKSLISQEKHLNKKISNENLELRNTLETLNREKQAIETQNIDMKSSFLDLEKEKTDLEEKCGCITSSNQSLRKVIETNKDKIQHLEKFNQQLQEQLSEQNQTDDRKLQDFQRKIDVLSEENIQLKTLMIDERDNQTMLKKQIHSLELYYDNEIKTKESLIEDLKSEINILQMNANESEKKLTSTEDENKKLYSIISDLNKDILSLNKKLENINNLSDPKKCHETIKIINEENQELSKKISALQKQLQRKTTEKIVEIDVASQKVTEKDIYSNLTTSSFLDSGSNSINHFSSYKESSIETCNENMAHRISSLKTAIKLLDNISFSSSDDIKSTSLPNLDIIKQRRPRFLDQENVAEIGFDLELNKKSSSVECLANNETKLNLSQTMLDSQKNKYDNRLEMQLETIYRLRKDLNEILLNLNLKPDSTECISAECTNKFKLIVESLQQQVNELNLKSAEESLKCHGLQAELKGLKGQMVNKETMADEIKKLRKELYKQKVESVQEIEKCRIKKEAEILEIQFKLKQQFQEKRLKLLADLTQVQDALQKKNDDDDKIKDKCQCLMKQVTINQELRNIKSSQLHAEIPTTTNVGSELETGLREIFQPVSRPSFEPEFSGTSIRSKLSTIIEQNRLDAEPQDSFLTISSPEEKEKYLFK